MELFYKCIHRRMSERVCERVVWGQLYTDIDQKSYKSESSGQ